MFLRMSFSIRFFAPHPILFTASPFRKKNRTYLLYFAQERDAWVSGQSLRPLLPVSFRYMYVRDSGLSTGALIKFDCYEPSGSGATEKGTRGVGTSFLVEHHRLWYRHHINCTLLDKEGLDHYLFTVDI